MTVSRRSAPDVPRVVLGHDYLTEMGGAERVVVSLLGRYPDAPLLTAAFRPGAVSPGFAGRDVHTSFLDRLAGGKARTRALFPLLPLAFRSMQVPPGDLLLSSSSGFAHHLRPADGAVHAWYCHTPPRFLWEPEAYFRGRPALRAALAPALAVLRRLDLGAAARIDLVIANSRHTARRIRSVYGLDAPVLHPPIPVDGFSPTTERSGRFVVVSRLLAYKRIDLAIAAARLAGVELDVIGDGPERRRLQAGAGPGIRFLGRLPDDQAWRAMARATAVLVPGVEDFGIVAVEAQASGRPPIARAAGGAPEIVEHGVTGYLVDEPSAQAFAAAMRRAAADELPAARLVASARRFDVPVFTAGLDALIDGALERRRSSASARIAAARA